MRKGLKRLLATGAVASMAFGVSVAATSAQAAGASVKEQVVTQSAAAPAAAKGDVSAAGYDCGWNQDWMGQAYYRHCGSGAVKIQVNGTETTTMCVGEGITYLGSYPRVTSAWYIGAC